MYQRIVFAATQSVSFAEAAESLAELSELTLLPKRVWRAARRIGVERVAERRQAAADFERLPLPAQRQSPVELVPRVACVQMDGGRFQRRARKAASPVDSLELQPSNSDAPGEGFWRESKVGVLLSMASEVHAEDPCPQLPATFADPGKMREIAREIKGFTSESPVAQKADEEAGPDFKERVGRPEVLVKSVVATSADVAAFGPLLASAAYERGFHAAARKAFVADGAATNWGVWQRHFSHYTPILDFVHALMYVYAGAMAGRDANAGWSQYRDWSQWLWQGQVERLLAALEQRQQELGRPEPKEKGTPRAQVASSLAYLSNQSARMRYDHYRQQGLPITSSAVESTIKQINRRVKGTEKFWDVGDDPMLHLVADRLSQTQAASKFWSRRLDRLIRSSYHQAA